MPSCCCCPARRSAACSARSSARWWPAARSLRFCPRCRVSGLGLRGAVHRRHRSRHGPGLPPRRRRGRRGPTGDRRPDRPAGRVPGRRPGLRGSGLDLLPAAGARDLVAQAHRHWCVGRSTRRRGTLTRCGVRHRPRRRFDRLARGAARAACCLDGAAGLCGHGRRLEGDRIPDPARTSAGPCCSCTPGKILGSPGAMQKRLN